MKKRLKILAALAASIAMIAIGQRSLTDSKERDARTEKAQVEGLDAEAEAWFI